MNKRQMELLVNMMIDLENMVHSIHQFQESSSEFINSLQENQINEDVRLIAVMYGKNLNTVAGLQEANNMRNLNSHSIIKFSKN